MAFDKQVLMYQLLSLRAAVDAALALLSAEEPEQSKGCQHPEERRVDMSTMGHRKWRCRDCGHEEGG